MDPKESRTQAIPMTITEKKYLLREMRPFVRYKPTFGESKLIDALYVALGYFDIQGNPKSRRMRRLAGETSAK